ncbi:MAG: hypothetical protein ACXWMI_11720, partial [Syntrophales bacterium]
MNESDNNRRTLLICIFLATAVIAIYWQINHCDFTKYDEHAVKQMPGNIELLRYRRYGNDLLLLELVHAPNTRVAHSSGNKQ